MGRVRILQTGDIHLGKEFKRFGQAAAERQNELLGSFRRQVDFAIQDDNQIDAFVIAGDLFDSATPNASLVGEVRGMFKRLAAAGIKVVLIPGTHDGYGYKESVYKKHDFSPDTFVFTNQNPEAPLHMFINGEDVFFYGFAYDPINSQDPMNHVRRIEADGIHIGIFHCSVTDRSDIQIRKKDLPVSSDKLASYRFDYSAIGHYHNFKEIRDRYGNLVAAYAGSPEATKMNETGDRYFLVLEFEDRRPSLSKHKSNIRETSRHEVDVTGLQTIEDVYESCMRKCSDGRQLLHFELSGIPEFIIDSEMLLGMLRPQFFYVQVSDNSTVINSLFVRQIAGERATIRKLFLEELQQRIDGSRNDRERDQLALAMKIGLDEFYRHSR